MRALSIWFISGIFFSTHTFAISVPLNIKQRIGNLFPPNQQISISQHDEDLWQVQVGAEVYFASSEGRYFFAGPVIDLKNKQNLTRNKSQQIRQQLIADLPDNMYLTFPSQVPEKRNITVFTDIDCPYCRKLHDHIKPLNERGVTVNYVMLPRAGVNSNSYRKAISAVCNEKPQQAMTKAMAGVEISPLDCDNTIEEQLAFARHLGINSTPVTVLPNGEKRVGYYNLETISKLLEL